MEVTPTIQEIASDPFENYVGMTDYRTAQNQYEVHCVDCYKAFYVDKETIDEIERLIVAGLDNPVRCTECRQNFEALAYESR